MHNGLDTHLLHEEQLVVPSAVPSAVLVARHLPVDTSVLCHRSCQRDLLKNVAVLRYMSVEAVDIDLGTQQEEERVLQMVGSHEAIGTVEGVVPDSKLCVDGHMWIVDELVVVDNAHADMGHMVAVHDPEVFEKEHDMLLEVDVV